MASRAESAAATRSSLLAAAGELLDRGGPDAVTLRAVGAQCGVSRAAPYRHFDDKAHLLAVLATAGWAQIADDLLTLKSDRRLSPSTRIKRAIDVLLTMARQRPHLYTFMCSTPSSDPAAAAEVALRVRKLFVAIVEELVGTDDARRVAALLLASAHGIGTMELSGELSRAKWGISGDALVSMLVESVAAAASEV